MKVLVFGASGRTGRELVKQGLEQTAFVLEAAKFGVSHAKLQVHQGDVSDRAAVESATTGQGAVISALDGASLLKREPTLIVGVDDIIITTRARAGVRRFVYLSGRHRPGSSGPTQRCSQSDRVIDIWPDSNRSR
jgi:putative NADH-flavin reductase